MTLKNAAVLALAGMSLLTILLLASLIHVLASVSVLVFF